MTLKKNEIELIGKWIFKDGEMVEDPTTKRINLLIDNFLIKVATDISGWNTLYQDSNDNRYWELIYSDSDSQGGGSPSLINLTKEDAILKFNINDSK